MTIGIRVLTHDDARFFTELRMRALREEPLAFGSEPETDFCASEQGVSQVLGSGMVFGAFEGEQLAGMVGLFRDPHRKARHKLQLWGMYVRPQCRGRGISAALLRAAIEHARAADGVEWIELGVTSAASRARGLYERAGFRTWGNEPDALRHEGASVSEERMSLRVK